MCGRLGHLEFVGHTPNVRDTVGGNSARQECHYDCRALPATAIRAKQNFSFQLCLPANNHFPDTPGRSSDKFWTHMNWRACSFKVAITWVELSEFLLFRLFQLLSLPVAPLSAVLEASDPPLLFEKKLLLVRCQPGQSELLHIAQRGKQEEKTGTH